MSTKFCPYCGQQVDQSASVCPYCGKSISDHQSAAPNVSYANDIHSSHGGGLVWITFLRVIAWIIFAGIIISGLILGVETLDNEGAIGLLVILGGVLAAFMVTSSTMVMLNNASNLRKIANNSAEIIELLKRK